MRLLILVPLLAALWLVPVSQLSARKDKGHPTQAAAVERLAKDLQSENKALRLKAAVGLSSERLAPELEDAVVAALLEGLNDQRAEAREQSARAVRNLGSRSGHRAIPDLLRALADSAPGVREQAVTTLANFPDRVEVIAPAARKLLTHRDAGVRQASTLLLGTNRFGLGEKALPDLTLALKDTDAAVRLAGVRGLAELGPKARPAVSPLATLAHTDSSAAVRERAVEALVAVGSEVVPELIELLGGKDAAVRTAALVGLGRLGRSSEEAVKALARVAGNGKAPHDDRYLAVAMLGELGPAAKAAVPTVKGLLDYPAAQMRSKAAETLR